MQDNPPRRLEGFLVIGARGVSPELQHSAGHVNRARDASAGGEFVGFAKVYEDRVARVELAFDSVRVEALDPSFGFSDQFGCRLGHRCSSKPSLMESRPKLGGGNLAVPRRVIAAVRDPGR
jgi:hypothetical protein